MHGGVINLMFHSTRWCDISHVLAFSVITEHPFVSRRHAAMTKPNEAVDISQECPKRE